MSLYITSIELQEKTFFEKAFLKGIKKNEVQFELPKTVEDEHTHLWYFPKSQKNQELWNTVKRNDWCLFGIDGKYTIAGKFLFKVKNTESVQNIFPKSFLKKPILIAFFYQLRPISLNFLKTNREFGLSESLLKMHKMKFVKVRDHVLQEIKKKHGGLEEFLKIKENYSDKKINFPIDAELPPEHITYKNTRIVRDTVKTEKLKKLYDYKCQICNFELIISKNKKYSEVHHIWPLGEGGMDNIDNMLVLCPNHHTQFDYAVIGFDKNDPMIIVNRKGIAIGKILFKKNHIINKNNIMYHMGKIK